MINNKNLSKELLELCNVEIKKVSTCLFYNECNFRVSIGDDICEYTDNNKIECEDCSKSKLEYELIPDLKDPFNFIELIETKVGYTTISKAVGSYSNREDFLEKLIEQLKEHSLCNEEEIKQAIKDKVLNGEVY